MRKRREVEPLFVGVGEAARRLGIHRSALYKRMDKGRVPWVQIGGIGLRKIPMCWIKEQEAAGLRATEDAKARVAARKRPKKPPAGKEVEAGG